MQTSSIIRILFISALFIKSALPSHAQDIVFKPVFINACNQNFDLEWGLQNKNGRYISENQKSVQLEELGTYNLWMDFRLAPISIEITKRGINTDTIYLQSIELVHLVSNPPISYYTYCGEKANGQLIDYHLDGSIRLRGNFKDGKVVDSITKYYQSGGIESIDYRTKNRWISYYENGNLKKEANYKKRFLKTYYENGNLATEEYWNKKETRKINSFYEDGAPKSEERKNKETHFYHNGNIRKSIKRREILILDRIFGEKDGLSNGYFYKFKWRSFDSIGSEIRYIEFLGTDFEYKSFPTDYSQIDDFLVDNVIYYKDDIEAKKIVCAYETIEGKYIKICTIYKKLDGDWSIENKYPKSEIYDLIKDLDEHFFTPN